MKHVRIVRACAIGAMCLAVGIAEAKSADASGCERFRPPAVPLVSVDPFFSVWSPADRLTDAETAHWTGAKQPISVMLEADGKTWRLCGLEPKSVPALPQKSLEVRPLQTVYKFAEGGLDVELVFTTPLLVEDLDVFSRPVTYVTARVKGAKEWRLKASISPALATNDDRAQMVTNRCTVAGLPAVSIGRKEQIPLSYSGDCVRCDWGWAWLVGPSAAKDGEAYFMLAYDDVKSIRYFGDDLPAWWRRDGLSFMEMLERAAADRLRLVSACDAFDGEMMSDLRKVGGEKYARLASLLYRQTYTACKLVADRNNQPFFLSKEQGSNGCIGTVDVLYPQLPQMLLMCPTLARATLAPILVYAANPRWPWPFAPHDLGRYPLAIGQRYAGGEHAKDESKLMPVEESGNMIIAVAALAHIEGSPEFASQWWPLLTKWARYLEKFGFDPGDQLCTDDFAGHLAHNANLAIKSIIALGCYGRLAGQLGDAATAQKYTKLAKDMVPMWMEAAKGGRAGGYRLTYDQPDTWSSKYNLAWDRVLGLGLFPPEVTAAEMRAYKALKLPFGLPLDSRRNWTKSDWAIWCSTLTGNKEDMMAIVDGVYRYANETQRRRPFADLHMSDTGRVCGMYGRSVMGGAFMPMLCDAKIWKKYASRDKAKTRLYAPLPVAAKLEMIVPEGRAEESATWKYTFTQPPAGWEKPDFDDSSWSTGRGGFGTPGTPGATIGTKWSTSKIWLRRHVKMDEVPRDLHLSIHHDEDTTMWFNGEFAGTFVDYTCDYKKYKVPENAVKALRRGDNVIASVTRQKFGGQYIDWGLAVPVDNAFNLASFNIRCVGDKGVRAWTNRLQYVLRVISEREFDVVGMQEVTTKQRCDLDAALGPGWTRVGVGRQTDNKGESSCIYYRKDRFDCLDSDTFWLSETPRVAGSKSWKTACPRVCTWGLFLDKKTGRKFRYYNTHLDHRSAEARENGMKLIISEMCRLSQGETVLLSGDLNTRRPCADCTDTLFDTLYRSETPHEGPEFTFSNYRARNTCRIDYVFATGNVRVLRHVTCSERPDGVHPSDHDAVMVKVCW